MMIDDREESNWTEWTCAGAEETQVTRITRRGEEGTGHAVRHRATRSTWQEPSKQDAEMEPTNPKSMHRSRTALRKDQDQQEEQQPCSSKTLPSTRASHQRCSWTRRRDVVGGARGNGVGMFSVSDADMERSQSGNRWLHQSCRPVDQHGREVLTDHQHRAQQEERDLGHGGSQESRARATRATRKPWRCARRKSRAGRTCES